MWRAVITAIAASAAASWSSSPRARLPAAGTVAPPGGTAAEERAAAPLMAAEHAALAHAGWSASGGQVAGEASASSPGGRRYVSYGPAAIDLAAIAKGNVRRDPGIVAGLRREAAAHAAALVVVVQVGTG